MKNNFENPSIFPEQEKQISPDRIFYHNAAHAETKEDVAIDFFALKSESTLRINNRLGKSAEKISEARELMKSAEFSQIKEILLVDFGEFNNNQERNAKKLRKLLKDKNLPNIKKLINTSGDIFELRNLIKNQVQEDKEKVATAEQLKKIKEIRDTSYFLTKEDESFRDWSLVSFDMKKILENNFSVFETNNEIADKMSGIAEAKNYADSFKKIESLEDCLKYKIEFKDDYDRCSTDIVYRPYCPEYMIQPPSKKNIIELFEKEKDKLRVLADKYWIIPAYFYNNTKPILHTSKVEHSEKINLSKLDPVNNDEDYHLIVNILFNEAVIDIKIK